MKKTVPVLLLVLSSILNPENIFCQPPGIDDSIMSIKKKWTKRENHIHAYDSSLRPSHFPIIISKLDAVAGLFKLAYPQPTGTAAAWYSQIRGQAWFKGGPSPYGFNSLYDYFYYNKAYKKIINAGETGTWAYAHFNDFNWLLDYSGVNIILNNQNKKVWKLAPGKGTWKGYPVFEPESYAPNGRLVLITKGDQSPLKPVSQLEYLNGLREKELNERSRILKEMKSGMEKAKGILETMTAERLKIIDDYIRSNSQETLQQQAIVNAYQDFIFKKKFEDPLSKFARKLVYLDQSYFNRQLPSYEPQVCILFWRWNNNGPGLNFRNEFEANFPVEALKAMLK